METGPGSLCSLGGFIETFFIALLCRWPCSVPDGLSPSSVSLPITKRDLCAPPELPVPSYTGRKPFFFCPIKSSVSDPRYMFYWQATLELADFPLHKGSVGLLVQKWESAAASRPGPVLPRSPAPRAHLPHIISCSSILAQVSAGSSRADGLQENPDGPQHTQPFPVSVKELRNRFEALGAKKETEKSSLTLALKTEPGSPSVSPLKESAVKRGRAIFEKMSSENDHSKISEAGSRKPLRGRPKESAPGTDNTPLDFQETISLKDRLDLYKAAVSKSESINSFADVRYPYFLILTLCLLCIVKYPTSLVKYPTTPEQEGDPWQWDQFANPSVP
ncbi:uncharacterized protein [Heliangelus exortis]|uniref:uncharacterized protein n=1 Tax=Heliangelus exortis TaxID=472823 RepID=UPI003A90DCBE